MQPKELSKDPNAANRKADHISLALKAQVGKALTDTRFYYEPMLAAHPNESDSLATPFAGFNLKAPIWISSMTGGTEHANTINRNLAMACKEFGIGMGLGSCRSLLYEDSRLADFDVRKFIGDEMPLFANLGIAQIERLITKNELYKIKNLLEKLSANGLIIHVNPLQEWLQPEGDLIEHAPIDTIKKVLDEASYPIIVKEVGQGFGPASIEALLQLPLTAIDFAAIGGTNFAKLELLRSEPNIQNTFSTLSAIGHDADEMTCFINKAVLALGNKVLCKEVIISGGVKSFLDGYYLTQKCQLNSIYGQASPFLQHATEDYSKLHRFVESQINGLKLAKSFLKVR